MLLFVLGLLVGALLALRFVARQRATQRGREQQAVVRAEARLQALEAAALREIAEAGQIVPRRSFVPVSGTGSAEVAAAHVADRRFEVRWRRVRVPGSNCSGLLAEPVAAQRIVGARQTPAPGQSL